MSELDLKVTLKALDELTAPFKVQGHQKHNRIAQIEIHQIWSRSLIIKSQLPHTQLGYLFDYLVGFVPSF